MAHPIMAAVQMNSGPEKGVNLEKAERFIREAAARGAMVVALPEVFSCRGTKEQLQANAEPIPGPTTDWLCRLAKELKLYIHGGSIAEEDDAPGKLRNTSVLINPQGEILARYTKLHLFNVDIPGHVTYRESDVYSHGRQVVTVETTLVPVGLSICYDLRFPELYRRLTVQGARIIFVPSDFTLYTGKDHWEPLLRARAIENQVYVVAAGQTGRGVEYVSWGRTMIIDPWGNVLAEAADREMVIYAEIDLGFQELVRREVPVLDHRRAELFSY